jgi:hypothetical protein
MGGRARRPPTQPAGTPALRMLPAFGWRISVRATIGGMYHYDPNTALEELTEDATLPNPVHVRDMILRRKLTADKSLELNRLFVEYQKFFGEAQKLGKEILKQLTA